MSDLETTESRSSSKCNHRVTSEQSQARDPSTHLSLNTPLARPKLLPNLSSVGVEIEPSMYNGPTSLSLTGASTHVPGAEASLPDTQSLKIQPDSRGSLDDASHPGVGTKETRESASVERPTFAPFFTLISNGETIVHPRQVHYLFSDDEASEVLTSVLLRSLNQEMQMHGSSSLPADLDKSSREIEPESEISSSSSNTTSLDVYGLKTEEERGSIDSEEERVVIVDVNPSGTGVMGVSSLSSKWQVLDAHIERAPTWNGTDEAKAGSPDDIPTNMMLKIEGVTYGEEVDSDIISHDIPLGVRCGGYNGKIPWVERTMSCEEEMHALLEEFDEKMLVIRRVMRAHSDLGTRAGSNSGATQN